MAKYQCSICNYIYDTDKGEPPEIKPGTAFEDIPDDWICPRAGFVEKICLKKYRNRTDLLVEYYPKAQS